MSEITFFVSGNPIPKQSYRHSKRGGYQPKRVTSWQDNIAWCAKEQMRGKDIMTGDLRVELNFLRDSKRRVDLDNLSKAVLDAMQGIVFEDDNQVMRLVLTKAYGTKDEAGVWVTVGKEE